MIPNRLLVEDVADICREYYERVYACEGQKWDLEREVRKRDYEVQYEPTIELHVSIELSSNSLVQVGNNLHNATLEYSIIPTIICIYRFKKKKKKKEPINLYFNVLQRDDHQL